MSDAWETTSRSAYARSWRRWTVTAAVLVAAGVPIANAVTASAAPSKNAIMNGNFAAGLSGWSSVVVAAGGFAGYPKFAVVTSNSPGWSWMSRCGRSQGTKPFLSIDVPGGAAGYVQQRLTVPKKPGRLTFRTWGNLDRVQVTISIVTVRDKLVHKVLTYSPPTLQGMTTSCSGRGPATESVSLSAFAGQKIDLRVQATSSEVNGTIADFDNFALLRS